MRTWADEVEDQRRERDREQRRLIECQHGALRRQCEICERDDRIAELEAALGLIASCEKRCDGDVVDIARRALGTQ